MVWGLQLTARLWRRLVRELAEAWISAGPAVFARLSGLSKQLLAASDACLDRGSAVLLASGCGRVVSSGRLAQLATLPWRPLTAHGLH